MSNPTNYRPVGDWFQDMPVTRNHWLAGLTLFIAFVIESWEMMILIFSSASIAQEFGLDSGQVGSLIGAMFLGMIPGALLWGRLAGTLGRRRCMILSIGVYGVFPLASALAPNFETLWAIRFLCGIVLSGALVVTFPYFEELVPVRVRGKATVYLSAGWPLGVLVAIAVTVLFSDLGWRWVIGFGSLSGLWAIAVWRLVPESPYWLAEKGRYPEADRAIERLSGGQMHVRTGTAGATDNGNAASMGMSSLFRGSTLRITMIQTVINFCFSWGYWGLASWMPELLAKRGLQTREGLSFIALSALFMFPGYISASYLTGRLGRKKVMLLYVFVSAAAGIGFANSASVAQMYAWNFTLSFFSLGAWGIWNTWLAEIYDTRERGAGSAWGISAQRVANAIAPVAIGAMLVHASFVQVVSFISMFLAITFFAAALLPETEGRVLR